MPLRTANMPTSPFSAIPRWAGLALVLAAGVLSGCAQLQTVSTSVSTLGGWVTPYRIDILQGNVVVREQVNALQPGMSRDTVRDILGTPLLASAFHAQRWDYVFTFRRQGQEPQQRRVSVFFQGDQLQRVESDELPTEQEFVASLDTRETPDKPPTLQATDEQLRAFQERYNANPPTPAAPAASPRTTFPPLEAR